MARIHARRQTDRHTDTDATDETDTIATDRWDGQAGLAFRLTTETWAAIAMKCGDTVNTTPMVLAWARRTLINVVLAVFAFEPSSTLALEATHQVNTRCAVFAFCVPDGCRQTKARHAGVSFTVQRPGPYAKVGAHQHSMAAFLHCAFVDVCPAAPSDVPRHALARVTVDAIDAGGSVQTRVVVTVIDVDRAISAAESQAAAAGKVLSSVRSTLTPIVARLSGASIRFVLTQWPVESRATKAGKVYELIDAGGIVAARLTRARAGHTVTMLALVAGLAAAQEGFAHSVAGTMHTRALLARVKLVLAERPCETGLAGAAKPTRSAVVRARGPIRAGAARTLVNLLRTTGTRIPGEARALHPIGGICAAAVFAPTLLQAQVGRNLAVEASVPLRARAAVVGRLRLRACAAVLARLARTLVDVVLAVFP